MADNAALAAAIQALTTVLTALQQQNAGGAAAAAAPAGPQLDPIFQNAPFDLSSRAGSAAFARTAEKLGEPWDGSVEGFPTFIINLKPFTWKWRRRCFPVPKTVAHHRGIKPHG